MAHSWGEHRVRRGGMLPRVTVWLVCVLGVAGNGLPCWAADFEYILNPDDSNTVWITRYTGTNSDVVVPEYVDQKRVVRVRAYAFEGNTNVTSVNIADSVEVLEQGAFRLCAALQEVVLGARTVIQPGAFEFCSMLTSIVVSAANTNYFSADGIVFSADGTSLVQYPLGRTNILYEVPTSVLRIADGAFATAEHLQELRIPDSTIECGNGFCELCYALRQVRLSDSLFSIPDYAFRMGTNLSIIEWGTNVARIGDGAFQGCSQLQDLHLPPRIREIGGLAFSGCTRLTNVTFGGELESIGPEAFKRCESLREVHIPDSVRNLGAGCFAECYGLVRVTLGAGISSIPESAFEHCSFLQQVFFPTGLLFIGQYAFYDCDSLAWARIPPAVTALAHGAFSYCASLREVVIGRGLKLLNGRTFAFCTNLVAVYFEGDAPYYDESPFDGTSALVCYLPGAEGWEGTYANRPTAVWYPGIRDSLGWGVESNRVILTLFWGSEQVAQVEMSTNLITGVWRVVATQQLADVLTRFEHSGPLGSQGFYRARPWRP